MTKYRLTPDEANYRKSTKNQLNCTHCYYSEENPIRSPTGMLITKCYYFYMDVDELHICDLNRY
ncbi:hypothetical protein [Methanobacterium alcaliphilum]|uniref:hypothetical protein n=1 Tax=Methanobacterium alcaliphilum TaxID=392018 RepID=UPI00200A75D2|nr:hypothetical protein [Methanobacterium alcaliphilum]MCK9151688.1 hypothetical protein [Methanobacterium alcaliphilum]